MGDKRHTERHEGEIDRQRERDKGRKKDIYRVNNVQ